MGGRSAGRTGLDRVTGVQEAAQVSRELETVCAGVKVCLRKWKDVTEQRARGHTSMCLPIMAPGEGLIQPARVEAARLESWLL